jgi:CRISPR-associated protein Cmr3
MSWTGYRLVPEDVLFFRDAKPSSIGDDHYLRSIFPPLPSTLYGLTRTQRLLEEGSDLSAVSREWWSKLPDELRGEIGEWGKHGSLRLRGPWLQREHEVFIPAPLDLRIASKSPEDPDEPRTVTAVTRLLPAAHDRAKRGWSHALAVMSPKANSEEAGGKSAKLDPPRSWFLNMEGAKRWMEGGAPLPNDFVDSRALWCDELRTGVGLQQKHRAHEEGKLYTFGFIRLRRGVSIGFELEGGALQPGCHVRIGGENRLARLEHGPSLTTAIGLPAYTQEEHGVYALLAPAIYEKGSQPAANVSAAVVPDAEQVGGWDLANGQPKPLRRAVPAGSVYWIDGGPAAPLSSLSQQENEGFGLMLRGNRPRR